MNGRNTAQTLLTARSNRDQAVTVPFKIRTEAFELYHSGQHHGKLKQRKPLQIYATLALFLALPIIFYSSYQVFAAKQTKTEIQETEETQPVRVIAASQQVTPEPENIEGEKKKPNPNPNKSRACYLRLYRQNTTGTE
ncbi:hypothetical protein SAMN05421690_10405 [Nitrosomonas sp. Nm51]|uniref:hypothetical protein n=1 Tax=Nitrosomonas sp. Nm51 TaxID=133720 RepID=UPI0008BC5D10|nr:hypothetical protein [Nitrosomonas sp. Nm51]SER57953.1 hypothetical protein SAMN05421690_10405 [Nitrosomonas sp. Nm51]